MRVLAPLVPLPRAGRLTEGRLRAYDSPVSYAARCRFMRTTLNIDDEALEAAMKLAEGRSKTEVVNEALRRFARAKRRRELLELRGKVRWEGDIDRLRKRR